MKKLLIIIASALLAVGCNGTKTYVIEGHIDGLDGQVIVADINGQQEFASVLSPDGNFSLEVESATPLFATLVLDGQSVLPLFLEGSPIKVEGDFAEMQTISATGTPANDAFKEFNLKQWELMSPLMDSESPEEEIIALIGKMQEIMNESYLANKDNLWGAYLFISNKYRELEAEEIIEAIEAYPKGVQKMEEMAVVREYAEGLLKTGVGQQFIDITMPNAEGVDVALGEIVKANKYVLVDFWASWCRPCMGEVPYLLADYAEYHDKGFEIYGISLDNNKDAWVNTMNDKGMKWVNVSILGGWEAPAVKDYAVSSIPTNFLINSEGVIIAKNLRGEALGAKLAEIFAE